MRYVCLAAVAALSVLAPSTAFGQLSITNYQFVSQQSATPTKSDFTYRADVVNAGGPLGSVTATLTSTDPFTVRTVPGQDTLQFAPVPANSQVTSSNTFMILVDRSVPFDFANLQWTFIAPVANAGPNQTAAVGSTVLSAATSQEQALEGMNGHGVFTWVVLQGLDGRADVQKNGYVSTLDLASYVGDQVPKVAGEVFNHQVVHSAE